MYGQRSALVLFCIGPNDEVPRGTPKKISVGKTLKFPASDKGKSDGKEFHGWLCREDAAASKSEDHGNEKLWFVGDVDVDEIYPVHTQCTFSSATVRFSGNGSEAIKYLKAHLSQVANIAVVGPHVASVGQGGVAIASFNEGSAEADDVSVAVTGSGSASAGDYGVALAARGGTVDVGTNGVAISIECGIGTVGDGGVLIMGWRDEEGRRRFEIGYGGAGISPHFPYVLDDDRNFVDYES